VHELRRRQRLAAKPRDELAVVGEVLAGGVVVVCGGVVVVVSGGVVSVSVCVGVVSGGVVSVCVRVEAAFSLQSRTAATCRRSAPSRSSDTIRLSTDRGRLSIDSLTSRSSEERLSQFPSDTRERTSSSWPLMSDACADGMPARVPDPHAASRAAPMPSASATR